MAECYNERMDMCFHDVIKDVSSVSTGNIPKQSDPQVRNSANALYVFVRE